MPKSEEFEQRTIETRLNCDQHFTLIDELLSFYASLRHLLWRDLIINELPLNDLKASYIAVHGVTARQFNSLAKDVSAKGKAIEELHRDNLRGASTRVMCQKKSIEKTVKRIKEIKATLSAIATFKGKIASWKVKSTLSKRPLKKPMMPKSIQGKFRKNLIHEMSTLRTGLHFKKRRLNRLVNKLECLRARAYPSVCFGSKALFKAQFNLSENGYEDHGEWLSDFRLARSSQMAFIGSSDESFGNQTVQYDPRAQMLSIRLPNAAQFMPYGKTFKIPELFFPEFLLAPFHHALSSPDPGGKKSRKSRLPVTYRLLRRINDKTQAKAYYLQASFALEAPAISSLSGAGVIGIDLNADHLAVTETDHFGNWIDSLILPFDLRNLNRQQGAAIIGDLVSVAVAFAKSRSKPLAIEELDFTQKKKALRLLPKCRRGYLSQFAYARFMTATSSRARREGVSLIPVNPAYTSLIGAYKYQGLHISSHEKAALSIARRAQGFTEGLKVFQGTLPSQAMMTKKTTFKETSRHVWGFYSDNQKLIRRLFIDDKNRPLLPLGRAISLAKYQTSLQRSLIVTRAKRNPDGLCRLSG